MKLNAFGDSLVIRETKSKLTSVLIPFLNWVAFLPLPPFLLACLPSFLLSPAPPFLPSFLLYLLFSFSNLLSTLREPKESQGQLVSSFGAFPRWGNWVRDRCGKLVGNILVHLDFIYGFILINVNRDFQVALGPGFALKKDIWRYPETLLSRSWRLTFGSVIKPRD